MDERSVALMAARWVAPWDLRMAALKAVMTAETRDRKWAGSKAGMMVEMMVVMMAPPKVEY